MDLCKLKELKNFVKISRCLTLQVIRFLVLKQLKSFISWKTLLKLVSKTIQFVSTSISKRWYHKLSHQSKWSIMNLLTKPDTDLKFKCSNLRVRLWMPQVMELVQESEIDLLKKPTTIQISISIMRRIHSITYFSKIRKMKRRRHNFSVN